MSAVVVAVVLAAATVVAVGVAAGPGRVHHGPLGAPHAGRLGGHAFPYAVPRTGRRAGDAAHGRPSGIRGGSGPPHLGPASGVLAVVLGVALGGPATGLAVGAAVTIGRACALRTSRRRRQVRLDRALPDLIDLFALAVAAGHPVARSVDLVAGRAPAAVRNDLRRAGAASALGLPLADVLADLGRSLGPNGRALTDALAAGARTGAPLGPALDRLAAAERERRRRAAEESARRLPVTLLFPLVCCILPAFGLLAVVPLLAASLGSLQP